MRARRAFVALLVGAALVAGCSSSGGGNQNQASGNGGGGDNAAVRNGLVETAITLPPGTPRPGGKLIYGLEGDTDGFDPTVSRWVAPGLIMANAVFDPLVAYAADGSVKPYLAKSIEGSNDFRTWTITLRPNIAFHNGQALDADALILFFTKLKASPLTAPVLDLLDPTNPTTKVDNLTVKLNMTAPWAQFPVMLTGQGGMVPAPEQLNNPDAQYRADHPIGTGPFKLKSRTPKTSTTMTKNGDYWRKDAKGGALPYLDEVEFKAIPDNKARDAALINGDINMQFTTFATSAKQLTEEAQQGKVQVVRDNGAQEQVFLLLNMDKPPLDDVRVRRAIAYAIDRDRYVAQSNDDPSWISYGVFAPNTPWYVDTGYPRFDKAKAKQLVDEYTKEKGAPPTFTLKTNDPAENQALGQLMVQMLNDVGMNVKAEAVPLDTFPTQLVFGQYDVGYARLFGAPDPVADSYWFLAKNASRPGEGRLGLNLARLRDPQVDQAIDKGQNSTDVNARKAAYKQFQERLTELVPYVWLTGSVKFLAADNTVRGITNGPLPDGSPSMPVVAGVTRLTETWKQD